MTPPVAILAYAPDGVGVRDAVVALIGRDSLIRTIDERARIDALRLPDTWDNCVVLVLLSPGALTDANLAAYVGQAAGAKLPILPVVPDLAAFSFSALPPSLDILRTLNAKGIQPGDGAEVLAALRQILGLEARARMRKVFISYRRADGAGAANEVFQFLWSRQCAAFLDTFEIAGAEPVQEVIHDALGDMDFVLFIDTPSAPESRWIVEELDFALRNRIPVASVKVDPPHQHLALLGPNPDVDWSPADPDRLEKVLRLVNRGIGLRDSLDVRMSRVADLARVKGLTLITDPTDRRRFCLAREDKVLLRVEYEPGALTLERLHRLYRWYAEPPACGKAVYIGGDSPILAPTREALDWARHALPLDAVTVREVVALLNTL